MGTKVVIFAGRNAKRNKKEGNVGKGTSLMGCPHGALNGC